MGALKMAMKLQRGEEGGWGEGEGLWVKRGRPQIIFVMQYECSPYLHPNCQLKSMNFHVSQISDQIVRSGIKKIKMINLDFLWDSG